MNVPGFLARQFYVRGSLRNTNTGFALDARNPMGDGTLVGVGYLRIDGMTIDPATVSAQLSGGGQPIRASLVSGSNPITVRQGDRVTLTVDGRQLAPGDHRLEVELLELSMGALRFSISDRLAA